MFHGEMDEGWFAEIWQEATADAASSSKEMIDYRGFVRLFDDTAADEETLVEAPHDHDDDKENSVASVGSPVPANPPPISVPSEPEPEPDSEPEQRE